MLKYQTRCAYNLVNEIMFGELWFPSKPIIIILILSVCFKMEQFAKTITNVIKNWRWLIHFNHVNFISQQEKQFAGKIKEYPPNMTCITIGTCVILHIMYQIYIRRSRIARTKRLTPKDSSRRVLRESELKIKIFQSPVIIFAEYCVRRIFPANATSGEREIRRSFSVPKSNWYNPKTQN